MLTASQVVTVAWITDGAIICADCAEARYSSLTLERARMGLDTGAELSPVSRYEAGSEGFTDYDEETDTYSGPYCDRCTEEIDPT